MKNKLPNKIPLIVNNKKGIYRRSNPQMAMAIVFPIIIVLPLMIGIMKYFFDTTVSNDTFMTILSFAVALVAVTFSVCQYVVNIVMRIQDRTVLFCARVETIKVTKKNINFIVKNIGSTHIFDAGINELKINEQYVPQNVLLNFLPVNETVVFSNHLSITVVKQNFYDNDTK